MSTTRFLQKQLSTNDVNQNLKPLTEVKPLLDHELQFVNYPSQKHNGFSVHRELKGMHSSNAFAKGFIISGFNAHHSGTNGPITKDTDLSSHVHYGTTRIWNADGSFNQGNWDKLVDFVKENQADHEQDIIRQSTLEAFVEKINTDYEVNNGRRYVSSMSTKIQQLAGSGARNELFDRLHCGYKPKKDGSGKNEFCIRMDDLELFYREPQRALLKPATGFLPIDEKIPDPNPCSSSLNPEPEISQTPSPSMRR